MNERFPPECPDEELEKFSTIFITDLDLTEFDDGSHFIDLAVHWEHKTMDVKKEYIIDGILLISLGSELPSPLPTIDKFLKEV